MNPLLQDKNAKRPSASRQSHKSHPPSRRSGPISKPSKDLTSRSNSSTITPPEGGVSEETRCATGRPQHEPGNAMTKSGMAKNQTTLADALAQAPSRPPRKDTTSTTSSSGERDRWRVQSRIHAYKTMIHQVPPLTRDAHLRKNCAHLADDPAKANAYRTSTELARTGHVVQGGKVRYGLILLGTFGVGKTWLATAAWKEVVFNLTAEACRELNYGQEPVLIGDRPLWAKFHAFIRECQDCYHPSSETPTSAVLRRYQAAPVLLLDDVGDLDVAQEREDRRRLLYELLDFRNDHMLPTIITTNLKLRK